MMLGILVSLVCLATLSSAADQSALITNLPGLSIKPPFRQYSGYLRASRTHQLHYWFVESQSNPASDPMVLWMNGGPGCSSLDGFLSEHGPFLVQDNTSLSYNPYAWNKKANVLYLESPAGVGFSYASDGNITTNDDQVADENHNALVDFFQKFPEFRSNNFFVTGESYAGIYIPTLTVRLLNDSRFNLKGIAVGNGLSSYRYNDASLVYFTYYHGLFGESLWNKLLTSCNCTGKVRCFFGDSHSIACHMALVEAQTTRFGLDIYNLYGPCYHPQQRENVVTTHDFGNLFRSNYFFARERSITIPTLLTLSKTQRVQLSPSCVNDTAATMYLNRADVRTALHIPSSIQRWETCSAEVNLNYGRVYTDMSGHYKRIMQSKIRLLIYNGDIDMACNFLGDAWFFDDLKYPVDYSRKQWFVSNSYGRQVGGVSKSYAHGQLVFTTVRGAGHMVPGDRPQSASHMFNSFINGQPL